MKAIRVTCPNCDATLRIAEAATTTTCEYCGTASTVMRRTGVLERILPPAEHSPMPRAIQHRSRAWIGIVVMCMVIPFALAGVCVATSVRQVRQSARTIYPTPSKPIPPAQLPPTWQGTDNVLVADVNGDGTPELVGRGRRIGAGDIIMLLAIDVTTGKLVYTGDTLGTYSDTYSGDLSLDGDHILYAAGESGEVRAYSLATGKLLWKTRLDERTTYFCAGDDPTHVNAIGADDLVRPLSRTDGTVGTKRDALKRHGRADACPRLPTDEVTPFETQKTTFERDGKLDKQLDDFYIDIVLVGPTGERVVSGSREKGTRVTTFIVLDPITNPSLRNNLDAIRAPGTVRWRVTAAPDGLGSEGAARTMVVGEREVCAVYYQKTYMLACWALADGKRLFDAEAPSFFEGLLIIGRTLVVTGDELRAYDLDTGRVRWQLRD
jgi:PQQ-like domain